MPSSDALPYELPEPTRAKISALAEIVDIPKSRNPEIPKSRNPEIPKSRNPEIPKSRNPEIPKSRNPEIPKSRFQDVSDEDSIKALTGLILYRHLDTPKEREVNRHWATLPTPLQMSLRKQRNFVLVNPNWGIWSLSTEELRNQSHLVQKLNEIAQLLGLGGLSVAQFKKAFRFLKKGQLGSVVILLLAGTLLTVKNLEGRKINAEMVRRLKETGEL